MSCTQRPTVRSGTGAQLALLDEPRKIRAGESGLRTSFDFGNTSAVEKTALCSGSPCLFLVDHVSGAVFAVLTRKAVSDCVVKAMMASVANWSRTDTILKSHGEPA